MAILQNQRVMHQQLLDIQHKHEELDKRLTDIIGTSDWYKVSIILYISLLINSLLLRCIH
jgi:hypothetical protein